jgi:hypothetical protein
MIVMDTRTRHFARSLASCFIASEQDDLNDTMSEFPAVSGRVPCTLRRWGACLHCSDALYTMQCMQLDDFDDFSAPAGAAGAQGDFLARERELLGDEFGPTPTNIPSTADFEDKPRTSFPSLDGGDSDDILKSPPAAGHSSRPSNDFMSTFERDQPAAAAPASNSVSAKVEDDDEHDDSMLHADINKFQTQYPDLHQVGAVFLESASRTLS